MMVLLTSYDQSQLNTSQTSGKPDNGLFQSQFDHLSRTQPIKERK